MAVKILRNYVTSQIKGDIPDKILQELRKKMRYKIPGFQFAFKPANRRWGDGYKYLITPKQKKFPSGLLHIVEDVLTKRKTTYNISDLRIKPTPSTPLTLQTYKLRDYQQQAVDTCLQQGSGIVKMATGGGKTAIAAAVLSQYCGLKRVMYVRRLDLMTQTIRVLERELNTPIGQIGGGVINIQELSVAMIPTVARACGEKFIKYAGHDGDDEDDTMALTTQQKADIKRYVESVECFIVDEVHCASCESVQMINAHSKKAYYRLGLSATPYRTDGTDILLNAVTGPVIVDIPASELIRRNFLVPPRVHFYKAPRRLKGAIVPPPKDYQTMYSEYIVDNDGRNKKICKLTKFLVDQGERPIILVQRQKHGKILKDELCSMGLVVDFIYGESSMTCRWEALESFKAGAIDVIIGSTILQEGIDIPCITALVNASGGKSSSAYYQKIGRAIRPYDNKTRAIVIDFIDEVKWLKDHSQERIKVLKTEPLYELKIQE